MHAWYEAIPKLPSRSTGSSLAMPQKRASDSSRQPQSWLREESSCGSEKEAAFLGRRATLAQWETSHNDKHRCITPLRQCRVLRKVLFAGRPAARRAADAASTFQFVLNVGAEVASFDSQQAFLRSRLREVGDSRHAAHDSCGCVIRDAKH